MSELRFAVLGPVRAWRRDTELDLGSPQQRAVLSVLLLAEGRQVSLGALVDAVWGEEPPKAAVGTVRTYVSRLRHCLETGAAGGVHEMIESAGDGYALPLRSAVLDLDVFTSSTRDAQAARTAGDAGQAAALLRDALGLWQGVPLADIPGEYAESQRVRLAELQMAAIEERLALDIELGGHVAAATELQTLLASHPMRERLSELLMLALYRSGRQADALAVFDSTRRLLSDELGIDPGPALREMHQRILQTDESLIGTNESLTGMADRDGRWPVAPSPVTALVGRDNDIEEVFGLLSTRDLSDHPLGVVVYSAAKPIPDADGASNHGDALAALRTDPALPAPDVHIIFADLPVIPPGMQGPRNGFTIWFALLNPHSRGSVRLGPRDPGAAPLIDPGFLTDQRDLAGMLAGLRLAREIGGAQAMTEWRQEEVLPGAAASTAARHGFLRRSVGSYYHPVGTCRMGTDTAAVADPQLRVHGMDGLRVADASVMPSLPAANTNATVLAIAERAVDLITAQDL